MIGTLSEETQVKVPTSKSWAVYGTLELGKVVTGKIAEAVDVIEGDGGTGTIVKATLKPGLGFPYFIEKFTKVDNENKIKEAEMLEGGFLDMGFNSYRVKIEIKDDRKDDTSSSCIVKLTLEYDIKEEFAANASLVTSELLVDVMNVANQHLLKSD